MLPFADRRFERLFCINAHHHFSDKRQAFLEARRVLRPGGSIMTVALDPHTGTDQWWVYDYFEGTLEIDRQRYPSCQQIREWMSDVGFVDTFSREVQHIPGDMSADEALQSGMVSPGLTSQLAVLTSDEFSAGVARIQAALANDSTTRLSADLRVYQPTALPAEFVSAENARRGRDRLDYAKHSPNRKNFPLDRTLACQPNAERRSSSCSGW